MMGNEKEVSMKNNDHNNAKRQSFVKGALYLSLAAIIVKVLSAVYKVPYQNITGDVGFYVYQQVYPFYGIALVLATYGFPVILSKLISDEREKGNKGNIGGLLVVSTVVIGAVNVSLGFMLYWSAPFLAAGIGDARLAFPLQVMAAPFLVMPFVSVLRGYYQGMEWMTPSAVSQVIEQSVRVVAILLLSAWAMAQYGPYEAGAAAALGSFFGGMAALFSLLFPLKKSRLHIRSVKKDREWKRYTKAIVIGGFYVCISAMSMVLMQLIDSLTMVRLLSMTGMERDMIPVLKGIYDRGWPIVQMGTVITTSFSLSLVPLVARASFNRDHNKVRLYTARAVKTGAFLGGAAAVGLVTVMPTLNPMLFTDRQGEHALMLISSVVLPASLFLTTAAILHGVGKGKVLLFSVAVGIVVKTISNGIFVPLYGINGAAIATLLSYVTMVFIVFIYMKKLGVWNARGTGVGEGIKLMIALTLTGVTALVCQAIWFYAVADASRFGSVVIALTASGAGAVAFLISGVKLNVIKYEDWQEVPKLPSMIKKLERKKRS
ncbi:putative polysaccharide biosynthesis protein [Alteribacter aurantiacus]|uniref:putative polysaccharide biosynthesis protein n=1 Tax=Alteribacter aurantiacus TaxID=254410 RepID=UPI00040E386E|nr:polysaccharide biosynthesis protein [Alteribacter aurantiacus]